MYTSRAGRTCIDMLPGSLFEVHEVSLKADYVPGRNRFVLKRGKSVDICISGKATNIADPIAGLQVDEEE